MELLRFGVIIVDVAWHRHCPRSTTQHDTEYLPGLALITALGLTLGLAHGGSLRHRLSRRTSNSGVQRRELKLDDGSKCASMPPGRGMYRIATRPSTPPTAVSLHASDAGLSGRSRSDDRLARDGSRVSEPCYAPVPVCIVARARQLVAARTLSNVVATRHVVRRRPLPGRADPGNGAHAPRRSAWGSCSAAHCGCPLARSAGLLIADYRALATALRTRETHREVPLQRIRDAPAAHATGPR